MNAEVEKMRNPMSIKRVHIAYKNLEQLLASHYNEMLCRDIYFVSALNIISCVSPNIISYR